MRTAIKILASGLLAGVFSSAMAVPMISVSGEGAASSSLAEQNFLATLAPGALQEDFEGFTAATGSADQTNNPFATAVGTFDVVVNGSGGLCDSNGFDCSAGLAILNDSVSPFSGRFSVPKNQSDNWLDSMDAKELTLSVAAGNNAVGFYMTDPNDAGGRFDIGGMSFNFLDIFGSALGNGGQYYISIYDVDSPLAGLTIYSNNGNDGYGIDKVTVGKVPEPGTLALLGLGLVGLGLSRKRK